jgi:Holliday junction resolvase
MTKETAEKKAVKDYLALKGYYFYHNLAGLGCKAGVPDITAIKGGSVWQIEVKAGKGKQSPNQLAFQQVWEFYGGNYICGGIDDIIKKLK